MTKEQLIEEVDSLKTTVDKGDRFLRICIDELYPDDPEIEVLDGSGDGGIDAFKISTGLDTEYETVDEFLIIQSKYGDSFSGLDTVRSSFAKIKDNFKNTEYSGRDGVFNLLRKFIQVDRKNKPVIKILFLISKKINSDELLTINSWTDELRDVFKIDTVCEILDLDCLFEKRIKSGDYKLETLGTLPADESTITTLVPAENLYKFFKSAEKKMGSKKALFDKNLRQFSGPTKINQEMRETLETCPKDFGRRNNGIKMISYGMKLGNEGKLIYLSSPSIINGCQTTNVIANYFEDQIKVSGKTIDEFCTGAWVPVAIINVESISEEEIDKITEASNKQNKINSTDLGNSLNPVAHQVRDELKKFGIYTDVKKDQTEVEFSKKGIKTYPKSIPMSELTKNYIACVSGRPDIATYQPANACFSGYFGSTTISMFLDKIYLAVFSTYLYNTWNRCKGVAGKYRKRDKFSPLLINVIHFSIIRRLFEYYMEMMMPKKSKILDDFLSVFGKEDKCKQVTEEFSKFYKGIVDNPELNDKILELSGKIFDYYVSPSSRGDTLFEDFKSEEKEFKETLKKLNTNQAKILRKDIIERTNKEFIEDKENDKLIKKLVKSLSL